MTIFSINCETRTEVPNRIGLISYLFWLHRKLNILSGNGEKQDSLSSVFAHAYFAAFPLTHK